MLHIKYGIDRLKLNDKVSKWIKSVVLGAATL